MILVDLTLPIPPEEPESDGPGQPFAARPTLVTREWVLPGPGPARRARVHYLHHWGMAGTYLDLPGHLAETDDGVDVAGAPLDRLYRLPAVVAHLDRSRQPGRISADELATACPPTGGAAALVVHALGRRRFDEVPHRSVYLGRDAVAWIVSTGVGLLVADVYESDSDPQQVFTGLFAAGVWAVCHAIDLHRLDQPRFWLTALPLRYPTATQVPCRLLAELGE